MTQKIASISFSVDLFSFSITLGNFKTVESITQEIFLIDLLAMYTFSKGYLVFKGISSLDSF